MRTKYRTAERIIDMHKYLIDCHGRKEWVISVDLLDEICEKYHKKQLELLGLHNVSQRSELLKLEDKDIPFGDWLDKYFKPKPTTELIYRQKNNNRQFTERELIRMYKQSYQL